MPDTFHLLDLPSQATAVEKLLCGRPENEKLAWLSEHGKLNQLSTSISEVRGWYFFESWIGMQCCFSINKEKLVFYCDNTTYTVKK